jgi:hypothetical protein
MVHLAKTMAPVHPSVLKRSPNGPPTTLPRAFQVLSRERRPQTRTSSHRKTEPMCLCETRTDKGIGISQIKVRRGQAGFAKGAIDVDSVEHVQPKPACCW